MIVKRVLIEHHLECLSLKGATDAHVKMPQCWKSHALAQKISYNFDLN